MQTHFVTLFFRYLKEEHPSTKLREEQLAAQSSQLCRIYSHQICLYCIFRAAQHVLSCGHTICDRCAHIFGEPVPGFEYRFRLKGCLYCLYQRPLVVDVLPPTISPSILAVDGGGVQGVIPLEFLLLVREHLSPCTIQEVVDLGLGTSSSRHPMHESSHNETALILSRGAHSTRPLFYALEHTTVLTDFQESSSLYI